MRRSAASRSTSRAGIDSGTCVLPPTLHFRPWDRPDAFGQVDLVPGRLADFPRARRGQNSEAERQGTIACLVGQLAQDAWHFAIWRRSMMFDWFAAAQCPRRWQQMLQMATPGSRIWPRSPTTGRQHSPTALRDGRARERQFPASHSRAAQGRQHGLGADFADRILADARQDIGGKGVAPLLPMLGVAPARAVRSIKLCEGLTDGDRFRCLDDGRPAWLLASRP